MPVSVCAEVRKVGQFPLKMLNPEINQIEKLDYSNLSFDLI